MARKNRIIFEGAIYHINQWGIIKNTFKTSISDIMFSINNVLGKYRNRELERTVPDVAGTYNKREDFIYDKTSVNKTWPKFVEFGEQVYWLDRCGLIPKWS